MIYELAALLVIGVLLLVSVFIGRHQKFRWDRQTIIVFVGATTAAIVVTFGFEGSLLANKLFVGLTFFGILVLAYAAGRSGLTQ